MTSLANEIDCLGNYCHGNQMPFYTESNFFPEQSVGFLIKRNFRFCTEALGPAFAAEGITFTQWHALISIYFRRATTGAELAQDLAHDKGATTRLIDALEQKGWVTRERDADDRRCVNLSLTQTGEEVARRARLRVIACWNEWLADWDSGEVSTLIALLQRLEATLVAASADVVPA